MRTDITTRAILTNRYGEDNRGKAFAQSSNTFMSCGVKSPHEYLKLEIWLILSGVSCKPILRDRVATFFLREEVGIRSHFLHSFLSS